MKQAANVLTIDPVTRVSGRLRVPGDKSISHRCVMLGSVARGTVSLTNLAPGADLASTIACFRSLGVETAGNPQGNFRIHGNGWSGLSQPSAPLDCGNSGTTLRLLAGLLAGRPLTATLIGDASLQRRPMDRVIAPLEAMGARVTSAQGRAPLVVTGGGLQGLSWRSAVASAQVKSAIMLAGLSASGDTVVEEPQPTRDHTERLFPAFSLTAVTDSGRIRVPGGQEATAPPGLLRVPGDPSSAAVWAAAAAALPGSRVEIADVLLNPRRIGFVEALRAMGAEVTTDVTSVSAGEPVGRLVVRHSGHGHGTITPQAVPDLIDELPVLAARAALGGSLEVSGAAELRVKESDRISALVGGLRAMGVAAEERPEGFVVDGRVRPTGGVVDACGDHRLVMAFAVAALGATGPTTIRGAEVVTVSYPSFFDDLAGLVA